MGASMVIGDTSRRFDDDVNGHEEQLVAMYMTDILHVVWQCHQLQILHGDLKLDNFLFADETRASPLKRTDFGGAWFIGDCAKTSTLRGVRGTPLYTAPEVLNTAVRVLVPVRPLELWRPFVSIAGWTVSVSRW
jgi:serine/threonine protein kinase